MTVFRIAKEKWIRDLSGIGAELTGGRWNPKGLPLLYCASSSSLAILEKLVNIDFDLLPDDLFIAELEVPDSNILKIGLNDLTRNWNRYPSPDILKEVGSAWIEEGEYFILQVPSAVNPTEVNYLINVQHMLMDKVVIKKVYPITLDERLKN